MAAAKHVAIDYERVPAFARSLVRPACVGVSGHRRLCRFSDRI
jgi:hypothetical protein